MGAEIDARGLAPGRGILRQRIHDFETVDLLFRSAAALRIHSARPRASPTAGPTSPTGTLRRPEPAASSSGPCTSARCDSRSAISVGRRWRRRRFRLRDSRRLTAGCFGAEAAACAVCIDCAALSAELPARCNARIAATALRPASAFRPCGSEPAALAAARPAQAFPRSRRSWRGTEPAAREPFPICSAASAARPRRHRLPPWRPAFPLSTGEPVALLRHGRRLRFNRRFRIGRTRGRLRPGDEARLIFELRRLPDRLVRGRGRELWHLPDDQPVAFQPALDNREIIGRRCKLRLDRRRQRHRTGDIERARIERRKLREIRIGNRGADRTRES